MSVLDVENPEAGQGGEGEGSSSSEKEAGLTKALQASRQTIRSRDIELAELRGRDAGRKEAATEKPREFTRTELQQAVDDGRMTPEDSDRVLSEQMENRIGDQVSKRIESTEKSKNYDSMIQAEVSLYTNARPDIMVEGSDDRELVAAEYNRQVEKLGRPQTKETELNALAAVFGPSNRLQNGKGKEFQTHQETGSDGGGEGKSGSAPKLPAHVKDHYTKMIDMGMYTGWDDEKLKTEVGADRWK